MEQNKDKWEVADLNTEESRGENDTQVEQSHTAETH